MHAAAAARAQAWVDAALAYKRLLEGSPLVGQEWITARIRC
ncbi:hypothetical protein AB5J55_41250 [Streptomyces sp. R11]|uniref:Uncharacterized protein n=1 Tax=Streptomyces sp. R11 TaxID=3238625 RepID=A0AB39NCY4_9ACTN